jgi:hypothetical protein
MHILRGGKVLRSSPAEILFPMYLSFDLLTGLAQFAPSYELGPRGEL